MQLQEIYAEFEQLGDWEDQCSFLIELGQELPELPPAARNEVNRVAGCQSRVWLTTELVQEDGEQKVQITADSDTKFVKGLVAILIAAYNGKSPAQILELDIQRVFERLGLHRHLMSTRRNGMFAMVERIRCFAKLHSAPGDQLIKLREVSQEEKKIVKARPWDAVAVRSEFPVLCQKLKAEIGAGNSWTSRSMESGVRPIYLDSGASAQKPNSVIQKEREVEEEYFANAYRGRYRFGARIDDELERARRTLAKFIRAPSDSTIVFTPGTTIGLNCVAFGWGREHVQAGDEILLNLMEHHANLVPWQQLAKERGAKLKFIPLTDDGRLDLSSLEEVLTWRTRIVAVTGMSNVLGTVNPIGDIASRAHAVGACVVVDGAQSVPHLATDVVATDVDFLVFSGHKLYGPTGVGVIYGKPERLAEMSPIHFGGHMIERVELEHSTWAAPPAKFEAGTLPIVQAIALGTAIDWITDHGLERIHQHEQELLRRATERLSEIKGLKIFGPAIQHKGAIISFRLSDLHPEDLALILDQRGIFTRHGHHCTMPLHEHLGVSATTRASFAAYNTLEDVDQLVDGIHFARAKLNR